MAEDIVSLTADLYDFMSSSESIGGRDTQSERLREWAHELAERFARARADCVVELSATVAETVENLRAVGRELTGHRPRLSELRGRWRSLGYNYEAMFAYIKQRRLPVPADVRLVHLKPKNYFRNLFHVSCGVGSVLMYELVFDRRDAIVASCGVVLIFALMELSRRFSTRVNAWMVDRLMGRISRPNEVHRIPAATWFAAALAIGVIFMPQRAIELGCLVLGVGDPIASLVGKRWGRVKLWGEKSLVGTLGFVTASVLVALVFLALTAPQMSLPSRLGVAFGVAIAGAVAELFSRRVDDNFSIPLIAGAVAAILL